MADRRRAVIDLGSNSFRLVVFETGEHGCWKRTDECSEMVRIGGELEPGGALAAHRMALALATLHDFAAYCASQGIPPERIEAAATSAIREAPNGGAFVERARRETGLPIRVLSQEDEARASYVAAVNSTTLRDGVVLDLGGGSLELVAVHDRRPGAIASWPLGAVRATERFLPGRDPVKAGRRAKLRAHAREELAGAPWLADAHARVVGLGGTVRSLAAAASRAAELPLATVQGFLLTPEALDALVAELAARPAGEREDVPGIKRGRGELIVAGAVVLQAVLDATGAPGIEVTEAGLREGLLLAGLLAPADPPLVPDVRAASVRCLAREHGVDLPHAEDVAALAQELLEPGADGAEAELVAAAALLHDVGLAIDEEDHHKHASSLILSAGLPGFTPRELALIALLARYHHKGKPRLGRFAVLCEDDDEALLQRGVAALRAAEERSTVPAARD